MSISHAYNDHVNVVATGQAVDRDDHTVYLGVTGHKTSLKSVWATFAQGKTIRTSWQFWAKRGLKYGKPLVQPVSESPNYQQMVVLAKGAHPKDEITEGDYFYLLHLDPHCLHLDKSSARRGELARVALPDLQTVLARRLNAYLPIPVLDEWGAYLWQRGTRALHVLDTHGDCLLAVQVLLNTSGWQDVVSTGLRQEHISF